MSGGTPDLARLVEMIMKNPKLVEEIGNVMKEEPAAAAEPEVQPEETVPVAAGENAERRENRRRLLGAMKNYLSPPRRSAVDSFLAIADILDSMKGGG